MSTSFRFALLPLLGCLALAATASAQSVEPLKGQTPEQMQKDVGECQASAKSSSGYDPAAPPPQSTEDEKNRGARAKGAAKGAAAGAVVAGAQGRQHDAYDNVSDDAKQEYRQENAKDAAKAGAAVAASQQRQDRRQDRRDDKQAAKDADAKKAAYQQAYSSCVSGRGYSLTP